MSHVDAQEKIAEIVHNPLKSIADWKKRSGGKVVGCLACMPPFVPEELIHAAGMLPVGLWGAEIPVRLADAKLQSFACSVARTSLEMGLNGTVSVCDAFLFPSTCDAFQNLSEVWKTLTEAPCYEVTFPKQTESPPARRYLVRELERLKRELEAFSGAPIGPEAIRKSVRLYNDNRRLLRELDEKRTRHPGLLSPRQMMEVVLAASFLPKEEHSLLVGTLLGSASEIGLEDKEAAAGGPDPVRIHLTGIMARPAAIPGLLEELGVRVVGDDLGLGSLYYAIETPAGGSPLADLAEGYLRYPPCSTVHPSSPGRAAGLIRRVQRTGAEGVLILATKFCEPEFFDVPQLREDLEEAGIPSIVLETELSMTAPGSVRTRVEAFVETLKQKKKKK
jgi:bcr-type benzoyl-CoA reductase subunit C